MNHLKMTVLVDNTAKPLFLCEWGLSILIDADDTRILLDTGSSGMFAENAKQLGVSTWLLSGSVSCLMRIMTIPTVWILSFL